MRRTPAVLAVVTTAAVAAVLTLASAGPVRTRPTPVEEGPRGRQTLAMGVAFNFGRDLRASGGDPRSVRSLRAAAGRLGRPDSPGRVWGILDTDHDGLDDDGRVLVTVFGNTAAVDLTRPGPEGYPVADAGSTAPAAGGTLRGSAAALARELCWFAEHGQDPRDMSLLALLGRDAPAGVGVSGAVDANHDGLDDDGRLRLSRGAATLSLDLARVRPAP